MERRRLCQGNAVIMQILTRTRICIPLSQPADDHDMTRAVRLWYFVKLAAKMAATLVCGTGVILSGDGGTSLSLFGQLLSRTVRYFSVAFVLETIFGVTEFVANWWFLQNWVNWPVDKTTRLALFPLKVISPELRLYKFVVNFIRPIYSGQWVDVAQIQHLAQITHSYYSLQNECK